MTKKMDLHFSVNGKDVTISVEAGATLAHVLREQLGLTGTKMGCSEGECGACTVLVDGIAVDSCIYPALKTQGRSVVTIEGLQGSEDLHPLQRAFLEGGAVQCGYCTPGMLLSAAALLAQNPHPTEDEIRLAISGNLCRCTGYSKIVAAIESVADDHG